MYPVVDKDHVVSERHYLFKLNADHGWRWEGFHEGMYMHIREDLQWWQVRNGDSWHQVPLEAIEVIYELPGVEGLKHDH